MKIWLLLSEWNSISYFTFHHSYAMIVLFYVMEYGSGMDVYSMSIRMFRKNNNRPKRLELHSLITYKHCSYLSDSENFLWKQEYSIEGKNIETVLRWALFYCFPNRSNSFSLKWPKHIFSSLNDLSMAINEYFLNSLGINHQNYFIY